MGLVGLPGVLAVVWATVMFANIYAGVLVFASLSAGLTLTVAQVSILGGMILLAHSLPVEVSVASKAGVRVWFTLLLRIGGALLYGWLLFQLYSFTGWHSEEASVFFLEAPADPTLS